MIYYLFKKPVSVLFLLSIFCASCINELRLIKVKGRDPIPYEFSTTSINNNQTIEDATPASSYISTTIYNQADAPDGGEALSTKKEVSLRRRIEQKLHQTHYNQLKPEQQVQAVNSFKKDKRIENKVLAVPPPNQANVIIGSILIVAGTVLIIGGIASLFSGPSGIVFIVLGGLLGILGTILVFKGVATRKSRNKN